MPRIKVLVVDDSVVVRRMVSDVLGADADIEVVGVAANGRIALQKLPQLAPDLVTLDIEMPELDGIATVREIRKSWKHLPVIMFSTLSERGASATLEALANGATDYVTKPAKLGSIALAQERIRDDLLPKIKHLCAAQLHPVRPALVPPTPRTAAGGTLTFTTDRPARGLVDRALRARAAATGPVQVLAIGCSTGGPNALVEIIPKLPADFPVPVVITQHMPPMFTKFLADRLKAISALDVREATAGETLAPGAVWIAPGDYHLVLERKGRDVVTTLTQDPPENSCRPSVDVMLRSVVASYGAQVLSVILTGMGQDGLTGCELVHETGGRVLAQDEASSVVWGMPGFVARTGIAEAVVPISSMADAILERVPGNKRARILAPSKLTPSYVPAVDPGAH